VSVNRHLTEQGTAHERCNIHARARACVCVCACARAHARLL